MSVLPVPWRIATLVQLVLLLAAWVGAGAQPASYDVTLAELIEGRACSRPAARSVLCSLGPGDSALLHAANDTIRAIDGNLTIQGTGHASLSWAPTRRIVFNMSAGSALNLVGLHLSHVELMFSFESSLLLRGMLLGDGGLVVLSNCSFTLDCRKWLSMRDMLCGLGVSPGSATVRG